MVVITARPPNDSCLRMSITWLAVVESRPDTTRSGISAV